MHGVWRLRVGGKGSIAAIEADNRKRHGNILCRCKWKVEGAATDLEGMGSYGGGGTSQQ